MENLDNDVLEIILYRLPLGAASQAAKQVCKSWKTILANRRHNEVGFLFACHLYRDRFKDYKIQLYFGEEYDHIDGNKMNYYYTRETLMEMEHCRFAYKSRSFQADILVGSCNGLVCFQKKDSGGHPDEPFAICNPLTGEFIFLKTNLSRVSDIHEFVSSGFGYCQSTDEYKVVRLYTLDSQELYESCVQVYTIGSNEWRDMETFVNHTFDVPGVFANGALHWSDDILGNIIAFDLEDEEFGELPLPPPEVFEGCFSNELRLLRENLCLVNITGSHINIWAYKKKNLNANNTRYGVEEHDQKHDYYSENSWGWVKEFNIECAHSYEPFAITKSNEVLLSYVGDLFCYDPETRAMSKLGDDNGGMVCPYIEAIPHANSYVSLKDFEETWYGPGCSAAPQTNRYDDSLADVRDASGRGK